MNRLLHYIGFFALLSSLAFGQSAETPPAFQASDVHVSAPATFPIMTGGVLRGGRYELHQATMVDLIRTAWGVDSDRVIGGPNWLETDRFDVIAKAPPTTSPDAMIPMLRTLLADRFKLVIHDDKKQLPAFVLTAGKRPQLKETEGTGDTGCQPQPPPQNAPPGTIPTAVAICHNITMADFAMRIGGMAGAYIDHPVLDQTGLKGAWDFTLKWTARALLGAAGADGVSVFDAVDKQLGLKLESKSMPMAVIVVDSVNEKPTPNLPGVSQELPPAPKEFEVADIKPSEPGSTARGEGFLPGGRVDLRNISLKQLIQVAWTITSDDMLAGAPKWLDVDHFDLVAKVATTVPTSGPGAGQQLPVDIEALRLMIRALLVDRFKLATHTEDRQVPVYALVSVKPKLKPADPSNRAGCKQSVGSSGAAGNVTSTVSYTCQSTTMAQFAEKLQLMSAGDVTHPVIDSTGIEGSWDFAVTWSPRALAQFGGGGRSGDAGQAPAGAASDPTGGLSMSEAIEKQLGLKLDLQKRSMPALVIDHVEQKPTGN